ncbi:heme exporter protein CcmD [Microbulbifer variabilis]|uniref:heme exporter protein CcmD n=1 Tax=Microbulbifer variabilis TaxID=266805 RepID=UPI001CFC7A27|nr:heme exporter protein CcmD [Microbulbifer variabilis]
MQFQFANFAEFLAMDGHGIYVWVCFAATFAALAALALYPSLARRRLQRELHNQQRIAQRRRRAKTQQTDMEEPA